MKANHLPWAFALLAAVSAAAPATSAGNDRAAPMALPADWYPESIAAGPDGSFYVGSWRQGAVARVRPGVAQPDILVKPGANGLANGQGVLVDVKRKLLWVCSGTMGFTTVPMTPSALKSYDLVTGAARGNYPLPDKSYCNDLAQDSHGTIYVTDSLHPRVLRLQPGDKSLSIWKEDPFFAQGKEGYDLNGIALDGDSALYVSEVTAVPYLWRIPIQRDGKAGVARRIAMPRVLRNADAIRYAGPNKLVIFESNSLGSNGLYGGQISLATIDGDRATSLTDLVRGLNEPSSGVVIGKRVYFIESKFGLLRSSKDDPSHVPSPVPFDVQSVALP